MEVRKAFLYGAEIPLLKSFDSAAASDSGVCRRPTTIHDRHWGSDMKRNSSFCKTTVQSFHSYVQVGPRHLPLSFVPPGPCSESPREHGTGSGLPIHEVLGWLWWLALGRALGVPGPWRSVSCLVLGFGVLRPRALKRFTRICWARLWAFGPCGFLSSAAGCF